LFVAHLERDLLRGVLRPAQVAQLRAALLDGYGVADEMWARAIDTYTAIGLLHLAPDPFRRREPDWAQRVSAIIARAQAITDARLPSAGAAYTQDGAQL